MLTPLISPNKKTGFDHDLIETNNLYNSSLRIKLRTRIYFKPINQFLQYITIIPPILAIFEFETHRDMHLYEVFQ